MGWLRDGLYDFCSLPLAMKVHLQDADVALLNQLPVKYMNGDSTSLMTELKALIDILLHTEGHLIKEFNTVSQVCWFA